MLDEVSSRHQYYSYYDSLYINLCTFKIDNVLKNLYYTLPKKSKLAKFKIWCAIHPRFVENEIEDNMLIDANYSSSIIVCFSYALVFTYYAVYLLYFHNVHER